MHAIGEAAKRTGVKVPTIRFYEQEGLLPVPPRTDSGRRLCSDGDVRRLAFIFGLCRAPSVAWRRYALSERLP